jgi:tetratricopeptide (TPR) repeat protein
LGRLDEADSLCQRVLAEQTLQEGQEFAPLLGLRALALVGQGEAALARGQEDTAQAHFEQAVATVHPTDWQLLAVLLRLLSLTHLIGLRQRQGRDAESLVLFAESLRAQAVGVETVEESVLWAEIQALEGDEPNE